MSLFETLKKAIFYNPLARSSGSSHASQAPTTPANTTREGSNANAGAMRSTPAGSGQEPAVHSAPAAAPAKPSTAQAPTASVDVEAVLEGLNAQSTQKLNWRSSIVDLMKLVELDSSLENRKQLAAELGYAGDTSDSAAMNVWLHKAVMKKLAENGGKVPASLQ